jgi:hypothetical protein
MPIKILMDVKNINLGHQIETPIIGLNHFNYFSKLLHIVSTSM